MKSEFQQPWQFLDAVPMMEIEVVIVRGTSIMDLDTYHVEKSRITKVLTHCFYDEQGRKYFKKDGMGDVYKSGFTSFGMHGGLKSFGCRKWDDRSQQRVQAAEQHNVEAQIVVDLIKTNWRDERLAGVRHTIHRIVEGKTHTGRTQDSGHKPASA